jgi:hypothetical protein
MKHLLLVAIAALLLAPIFTLAHGGVSNQSGNVVVFLVQQPISPLIGEKVAMTFSIKDKDLNAITGIVATLKLVQTDSADPSKDKELLVEQKAVDVNGNFSFDHTFNNVGYYDVEITLPDPVTKEPVSVGFLVQPRSPNPPSFYLLLVVACFVGIVLGFSFNRVKKQLQ